MIAIIAGTGNLPIEAAKQFLSENKKFIIISLFPEENKEIFSTIADRGIDIIAESFYKAGTIFKILKKYKVSEILLIGKVEKNNLLKRLKLDWYAIKTLAKASTKSDSTIMQAIVNQIESEGFKVLRQDNVLKKLFVKPGILTGELGQSERKDIEYGLNIAKKLSKIDIGQTVIVKNGMIIAVEALEGTDKCIQRGIDIAKSDIIICKTAQDNQNRKFDLPTLGVKTISSLKKGEVSVIAWHSDRTLIEDKNLFIEKAKKLNITLVSV